MIREDIIDFFGRLFYRRLMKQYQQEVEELNESKAHFANGALFGYAQANLGKELSRELIALADISFAQTLNSYIKRETSIPRVYIDAFGGE